MLPPDTSSSLFPWRVVVPLLQVYGSFPYRMSPTNDPPVFSLPLCLWTVSKQVTLLALFFSEYNRIIPSYFTSDLGSVVYLSTIFTATAIVWLAPITMAARSNILAALLYDMSSFKDVCAPPTHRWYCKTKTLAFLLLVIVCTAFAARLCYMKMGVLGMVVITPLCVIFGMGFMLPVELSSMVFGVLGRRLLVSTEATVTAVSTLLSSDRSFKCEGDVEEAMEALCDLEAVIREVEVQRGEGTRCFFPCITMFLLMAILLAIANPYAIKEGTFMDFNTIAMMLMSYYIMAHFCHIGQTFVNQASSAEALLKDLKLKNRSLSFNLKVSQVMGSLSPLLTFDMCGWYTLSYSSFLGFINTVLTYLVIIFQVGGQQMQTVPSPAPPTTPWS